MPRLVPDIPVATHRVSRRQDTPNSSLPEFSGLGEGSFRINEVAARLVT